MTVSQTKLKRIEMPRAFPPLKLTNLMHLKNSLFFFLIFEDQRSISSNSNKGLLKDVLLNLFSQPWGIHYCCSLMVCLFRYVLSVIVTAFPRQAACSHVPDSGSTHHWPWSHQAKPCVDAYRSKWYLY